jgi:hypothetical protein
LTRQRVGWAVGIPWVLFAIAAVCVLLLSAERAYRSLAVHFAADHAWVFEEMRAKANGGAATAAEAAGCLEYVVSYYPSGTKLATGSEIDRVVEGYRAAVARDIIGRLRALTGDDLGDDPDPWIKKYAKE